MSKIVKNKPEHPVISTEDVVNLNIHNKVIVCVYQNVASVAVTYDRKDGLHTGFYKVDFNDLSCNTRGNKSDLLSRIVGIIDSGDQGCDYYVFGSQKEFFQAAVENGWD